MLISQLGNNLDSTVLKVCGDLTIENAEELKALLMKLNEGADQLSLDFSEIGKIDIAGLQLLCSAHKAWRCAGKNVICTAGTLDALARATEDSGYARKEGCMPLSEGQCLFTGGAHE
jgi:anti-anti-sigma regulatory factor